MEYEASIVIGTFNRPFILLNLIEQILKSIKNKKVEILVFDQSNPKNRKIIEEKLPRKSFIRLFKLKTPNTVKYLNDGWQNSKSEIIIYFDDDVRITENTINEHLKEFKNPHILGVAGRVINQDEKVNANSKNVGKIYWRGAEIMKDFSSQVRQFVSFPYGCNMSFRKGILKKIGGFDNKLYGPIYSYNEVDLGMRITKEYPKSLVFNPLAEVTHLRFRNGGTRSYRTVDIQNSNDLNYGYILGKNFTFFENIIAFVRRLPYQLLREPKGIYQIAKGYVEGKTKKTILLALGIGAVFLFVFFLRLWKAADFFSFNFDEEYQAHLAWQQVKHFHKIWIGVNAANLNYYLGPAFTYLNAFLFKLSHGDPIILPYFSSLLGITTTLSIYYVTSRLFDKKSAIIASLLYGGSALLNYYDRRFWNPSPDPIVGVWMFYSLSKARTNTRWFILSAILFALSFHFHLALMIFFPVIVLVIALEIKKIKVTTWLYMAISYLLITFPQLVFDLVHNFDNMRMPLRFLTTKGTGISNLSVYTITYHAKQYFDYVSRIWFLGFGKNIQSEHNLGVHGRTENGQIFLSLFSLSMVMYPLRKSFILACCLIIFTVGFFLYPGYSAEYYLLSFFALLTISTGLFISKLPNKLIFPLLSIYIIINSITIFTTTQAKYGLTTRKLLIRNVMETVQNSPFSLETYGLDTDRKYHSYGGWRYLFKAYGKTPTQSFADEFFGWIYPDESTSAIPVYKVIIAEEIKYNPQGRVIKTIHQGVYTAFVVKIK